MCYGSTSSGVSPDVGTNPRAHLMPNGKVIVCGMGPNIRSWDPITGMWRLLIESTTSRYYGSSILLPLENNASENGKILLVGGSPSPDKDPIANVEIVDFNNGSTSFPKLVNVQSITYRRKMQSPVILSNGKVVIFGGSETKGDSPVYVPEVFDPISESWKSLSPGSVPRLKHHVSLLLGDGNVWTAGGVSEEGHIEKRTEIFSPDYIFEDRPVISGNPIVGGYGGTIVIPTSNTENITSVSLLRIMSTTQYNEANQRLVWLPIKDKKENTITVEAPINANIAPPGIYMIHILNTSDIPSRAAIIKIM
jgi:Domain of unknown function (DUF1929)/Kelch motif